MHKLNFRDSTSHIANYLDISQLLSGCIKARSVQVSSSSSLTIYRKRNRLKIPLELLRLGSRFHQQMIKRGEEKKSMIVHFYSKYSHADAQPTLSPFSHFHTYPTFSTHFVPFQSSLKQHSRSQTQHPSFRCLLIGRWQRAPGLETYIC